MVIDRLSVNSLVGNGICGKWFLWIDILGGKNDLYCWDEFCAFSDNNNNNFIYMRLLQATGHFLVDCVYFLRLLREFK